MDETWEAFMHWLMQRLMTGLNCGSPTLPDDVPVAMLVVTDCFSTGGLKPMTPDETTELLATLDEVEAAMQDVPSTVSPITSLKFEATLKLMRAEALLGL